MRSFFTFIFLLSTWQLLFSQAGPPASPFFGRQSAAFCGHQHQQSRADRERLAKQFLRWQSHTLTKSAAPIRTIPIVIHLLEYDPAITDAQVENAVASLNNAFSHSHNDPTGDDYSGGTRGVDTGIQFCLAQKAPDGGLTNGIVRWRTDYENMDVDLEDAKLKTQGQWDPRYYLNIWVVGHLDTEIDQSYTGSTWWDRNSGLGGYSGGPGGVVGPDAKTDGVVVAGLGSALWAHEIGHYMSLAHTFAGGCANDDCLVDGDGICDTPPDRSQAGCNQNTCDTDTLSNYSNGIFTTDVPDMTSNFMDYSSCPSEFTQGQADKMLFVIDNKRINLAVEAPSNNDACQRPCNSDFTIAFDISERYPEPNVAIDFTSSIQGAGIDSYEWYVETLGHPGFNYPVAWLKDFTPATAPLGTASNLQHTFLDPGKYRVYLKAWNSADPTCFASYSRVVRVTCLGIDARFTPNVRLIASKQPRAKLLDSVLFTNRSVNATDFEWTVRHEPYDGMTPAQPHFISTNDSLHHTFLEPGDYYITLIAKNGANCTDTCGPFLLPVLDPTIDGRLKINRVDCYQEDSLRIAFEVFNDGFDTIRIGMPVTFYGEDPRNTTPAPKILGTYLLDKIVYGKDNAEQFVAILPSTKPKLNQVFAVFNDYGSSTFPITWPMPDENVMTVNSAFPTSGENELNYDNNFAQKAGFQFEIDLVVPTNWPCMDTQIQLNATHENGRNLAGIDWTPPNYLSCTNCLDPQFTLQDTPLDQQLILTSEYFCRDTVIKEIPARITNIPSPILSPIPAICPDAPPLDLASFVSGNNISWYDSPQANSGSATPPTMDTGTPGTYSLWVSAREGGCEGPKLELTYTINPSIPSPQVLDAPTVCEGGSLPELASLVTGNKLTWYLTESGGQGAADPPRPSSDVPGLFSIWVSQSSGSCESPRVEVSYTVQEKPSAPAVQAIPDLCSGETAPMLDSLVTGTNLRWYSSADATNGSAVPPRIVTSSSGSFEVWVSQTENGCESPRSRLSYTIHPIPSPPTVQAVPAICAGEPAPLLGEIVEGSQLQWYTAANAVSGSSQVPIIDPKVAQVNTYWVSQQDGQCESNRASVSIRVKPIPEPPTISPLPSLCVGDPAPDLEELIQGIQLQWYGSANGVDSISLPIIETSRGRTYQFWVSQTEEACEGPRAPVPLTVTQLDITASGPHEVQEGDEQEISVAVHLFPTDEAYFTTWTDADGQVIEAGSPSVLVYPEAATVYTVVVEAGACSAAAEVDVEVIFQIDPTQIFSPNGDSRNDTWYIGDIDKYPTSQLTIYNRWGAEVYQTKAYQNDWDGRSRDGRPLPLATYYYVVDLNQFGLKPVTGHVTIIR